MFNAANKFFAGSLVTLALLSACKTDNTERDAADSLVAEASAALDRGDFLQSEILLDSLSATYPKQIEAGRAALALRPKVMERKTEQEILELQALMQYSARFVDSIMPEFVSVARSDEQLEPYIVAKSVPANWRERNTVIARLNPGGEFYALSSLAGRTAKHTAVQFTNNGSSVTSGTVPYDGEAGLTRESVRFAAGKADTLGIFAVQVDGRGPVTVNFVGGNKAPAATLSAAEVHAFADTWRLSQALQTMATGQSRLEQLKAKLQLARDQQVRVNTQESDK